MRDDDLARSILGGVLLECISGHGRGLIRRPAQCRDRAAEERCGGESRSLSLGVLDQIVCWQHARREVVHVERVVAVAAIQVAEQRRAQERIIASARVDVDNVV